MPWPISAAERALGTAISAVSAEPPNASRPMRATRCRSAPNAGRHARRPPPVRLVALPVVERERVAGEALAPRQRQAGGGIQSAAQQANRFRHSGFSVTRRLSCASESLRNLGAQDIGDLGAQDGNPCGCGTPNLLPIDSEIVVDDDVAEAFDVGPRNLGVTPAKSLERCATASPITVNWWTTALRSIRFASNDSRFWAYVNSAMASAAVTMSSR